MVRKKECLKRTLQIKISRPYQERRQVKRMVRRMWSSMRSARKPSRRLPRVIRRSLGEEETFSLRGSRRAAQLRSSGRRRPVTMSALLLPLRQEVREGGVVEEEEEEVEVEIQVEVDANGKERGVTGKALWAKIEKFETIFSGPLIHI